MAHDGCGFPKAQTVTRRSERLYTRHLHANTRDIEQHNIQAVCGLCFAPAVLYACSSDVHSSAGISLHDAFAATSNARDAECIVVGALKLIDMTHCAGYLHLDATVDNIIIVPGTRAGCCNIKLSDASAYHIVFIDYETLLLPEHSTTVAYRNRFDHMSGNLRAYGWKTCREYHADAHRYRYDVHTFMVTLGRLCTASIHGNLLTAVARVLGHIPSGYVSVSGSDAGREYDEYLCDTSLPVASAADAVAIVVSACFAPTLRDVKWMSATCTCCANTYCSPCLRALDGTAVTCPYALPDVMGTHDDAVRAVLLDGLCHCGGNFGLLRAALIATGARNGDAARLIGLIPEVAVNKSPEHTAQSIQPPILSLP